MLSISSVTLGFLGTIKTVIVAITDRPVIKQLKQAGYYKILVDYLNVAVLSSFIVALASLFIVLGSHELLTNIIAIKCLVSLWLALIVFMLLSLFRILRIISKLLRILPMKNDR